MPTKHPLNNSIEGIGTDIIEIKRIREAFERYGTRFLSRLFTEKEIAYCRRYRDPIPHFAGRFAAKEAVTKALGTGLRGTVSWKKIEILNDRQGKPEVFLAQELQNQTHFLLSISHCRDFATATVIAVKSM